MSQFSIQAGTGVHYLPSGFALERGGVLRGGQLAYELSGAEDAPLVIVLGGISAGRHVTATPEDASAGWWEALVGAGRAIDTRQFRVLGVDFLGEIPLHPELRTRSDEGVPAALDDGPVGQAFLKAALSALDAADASSKPAPAIVFD